MKLALAKPEIRILTLLSRLPEASSASIAGALHIPRSNVYRHLRSLSGKGLVSRHGARNAVFRLAASPPALAFSELAGSYPQKDLGVLSGASVRILLAIADSAPPVRVARLREYCRCPEATLNRHLAKLKNAGFIHAPSRGRVQFSRDERVAKLRAFVRAFADSAAAEIVRRLKGWSTTLRIRDDVIVKTGAEAVPADFVLTGVSAFPEFGLPLVQPAYRYCYFSLAGAEAHAVRLEEAIIHALAMTVLAESRGEIPYILMCVCRNWGRINWKKMDDLAERFRVASELEKMRRYFATKQPPDAFYPPWAEFAKKLREHRISARCGHG